MARSIKFPVARDPEGALVQIDIAHNGRFSCLDCEVAQTLVAKRGSTRAWHFAHAPGSAPHGGEGWLHRYTKNIVADGIRRWLSEEEFLFKIKCPSCRRWRYAKFEEQVASIEVEYRTPDGTISDIALLDEAGQQIVDLEIEVTHQITKSALESYRSNGVLVLVVRPHEKRLREFLESITCEPASNDQICSACRLRNAEASRSRQAWEISPSKESDDFPPTRPTTAVNPYHRLAAWGSAHVEEIVKLMGARRED